MKEEEFAVESLLDSDGGFSVAMCAVRQQLVAAAVELDGPVVGEFALGVGEAVVIKFGEFGQRAVDIGQGGVVAGELVIVSGQMYDTLKIKRLRSPSASAKFCPAFPPCWMGRSTHNKSP